jgi:hypothetical protein
MWPFLMMCFATSPMTINEEAGWHFTPRDVVKLMADLIFLPTPDQIESVLSGVRRHTWFSWHVNHRRGNARPLSKTSAAIDPLDPLCWQYSRSEYARNNCKAVLTRGGKPSGSVDGMLEWAEMFPEEFWCELASLEGVHYSPRPKPLRWGRYLLIFVIDTLDRVVDAEVGKRNDDAHHPMNFHDPKKYSDSLSPMNFYEWLMAFGRDKVPDKIERALPIMKSCENMEEFRAKFDKALKNSLLQSDFNDIRW